MTATIYATDISACRSRVFDGDNHPALMATGLLAIASIVAVLISIVSAASCSNRPRRLSVTLPGGLCGIWLPRPNSEHAPQSTGHAQ